MTKTERLQLFPHLLPFISIYIPHEDRQYNHDAKNIWIIDRSWPGKKSCVGLEVSVCQ